MQCQCNSKPVESDSCRYTSLLESLNTIVCGRVNPSACSLFWIPHRHVLSMRGFRLRLPQDNRNCWPGQFLFLGWGSWSLSHQEPITRSEQRSLFGWDIVFTDRVIFSFEFPAKNICFLSGKFKVQLAVDPIKLSESVMGSHSSELSTLSYSLSQDKSLSNSSLLSAMFIKVGKSR